MKPVTTQPVRLSATAPTLPLPVLPTLPLPLPPAGIDLRQILAAETLAQIKSVQVAVQQLARALDTIAGLAARAIDTSASQDAYTLAPGGDGS